MEENNTEYIKTESETEETTSGGYIEETAEENTDSGMDIGESEDNAYDDTADVTDDNANSNTGSDTASDAESDVPVSADASSSDTEDSADITDRDLLESLNSLIEALSSDEETEAGETEGAGENESSVEPEISEYDSQTLETLQSIYSTLATIQSENELWHTETLKYREDTKEMQESIITHIEVACLLLIAVGFFTALLCGGKFADIFFKRMKGGCTK